MRILLAVLLSLIPLTAHAEYLGELSVNPYPPDGINNPFSPYGSPFSNQFATNSFATDAPGLLSGLFGSFGLTDSNSLVWG